MEFPGDVEWRETRPQYDFLKFLILIAFQFQEINFKKKVWLFDNIFFIWIRLPLFKYLIPWLYHQFPLFPCFQKSACLVLKSVTNSANKIKHKYQKKTFETLPSLKFLLLKNTCMATVSFIIKKNVSVWMF